MKMIQRYYLKEFFKLFMIITFGLSLVFSIIELMNRISDFMPYNPKTKDLTLYTAFNFPQYVLYIMPMSALISGLFVFGQAGRRKETVAIKASGGSIKALLMPFVYSGILLSIAGFLIGEFVVPDFSRKAHKLKDALIKKEEVFTLKDGTMWLRSKGYIVKIDLYSPEKGISEGISIMKIENDMLTDRIEAAHAEWRPVLEASGASKRGEWYLKDVRRYEIHNGVVRHYKEMRSDIIESPDLFREGVRKPEEMNIRELIRYSNRLGESGFRNIKILVDIQSKISYPLINLIMLVLGISLAVRGGMGGGLITSAAGISISLIYWFGLSLFLSMGYTGIVSSVIAAWLMPVIFGIVAFYLFSKMPE